MSDETSEQTAALLQALAGMVWMGDETFYGDLDNHNLGSSQLGLGNNLGPGNDTTNADIHGAANHIEPGVGDETLYNDFENLGSSSNFGHSSHGNLGPGPGKFLGGDTINADINIIHGAANHVMQGMGSPEDSTLDCRLMVCFLNNKFHFLIIFIY